MSFCNLQNISGFRVGIKLGVIPRDISKTEFATALNRTFIHTYMPTGMAKKYFGHSRGWAKNDFKKSR